jgi:hypothetical protein
MYSSSSSFFDNLISGIDVCIGFEFFQIMASISPQISGAQLQP